MPRDPRFTPQRQLVEVTLRTFQGRLLLTPSDYLNALLLGVLLRAQRLFPVHVHAFTFMSNHIHLLITVADADQQARFIGHLKKNIGDIIRRERNWEGTIWDGRAHVNLIADDATALERLEYICANGVKEHLVAHPVEWPGVSSAAALLHQSDIVAYWQGRDLRAKARRHRQPLTSKAYMDQYRIQLTPIPPLAGLDKARLRTFYRRMFDRIAAAAARERGNRPPAGAAWVRAQDAEQRHPLDRTPVPLVFGRPEARARLERQLVDFLDAYAVASARLAAGEPGVVFPPGCFPPRRPFVAWPPPRDPPRPRRGRAIPTCQPRPDG